MTALVKSYDNVLVHNRRKYREKELGGGVGVLLKRKLKYKPIKFRQFFSFQLTVVKVFPAYKNSLLLVSIYRVLFVSVTVFLKEIVNE